MHLAPARSTQKDFIGDAMFSLVPSVYMRHVYVHVSLCLDFSPCRLPPALLHELECHLPQEVFSDTLGLWALLSSHGIHVLYKFGDPQSSGQV